MLAVLLAVGFALEPDESADAGRPRRVGGDDRRARRGAPRADASSERPSPRRSRPRRPPREGLADLDRDYPRAQRGPTRTLYALLGLLPEGTDLREAVGSIFGEQVAGYYDPRDEAAADRRGRRDIRPRARRDDHRPRAQPRARGPGVRPRPRPRGGSATTRRSRTGACRGHGDGGHVRYLDAHFGARGGAGRSARRCVRAVEPNLPPFLDERAGVPVPERGEVRGRAATPRGRHVDARRSRAARRVRPSPPSRSCTRTSTCASRARFRSRPVVRLPPAASCARRERSASSRPPSCSRAPATASPPSRPAGAAIATSWRGAPTERTCW